MKFCATVQPLFADYIDGTLEPITVRLLETHLAECPVCRDMVSGMRRLTAAARKDVPWAPSDAYWNTLLPRIHERIARQNEEESGFTIAVSLWFRRLALPAAFIMLSLVTVTFWPENTVTTEQEVAALVRQLPQSELDQVSGLAQVESQFDGPAAPAPSVSMTDDDRDQITEMIQEEGPALPSSVLESDSSSLASNDDVFDAIEPQLDQNLSTY